MDKQFKILPPANLPNYVRVQIDNSNRVTAFSITELTPTEAVQYGEEMKLAFIKHYNKKTKNDRKLENSAQ